MKIKKAHKVWGIVLAVVLILALAGLIGASGCGEDEKAALSPTANGSYLEGTEVAMDSGVAVDEEWAYADALEADRQSGSGAVPSLVTGTDQKVIKDAWIEIEVEQGKFQNAFNQAQLLADRYGGYVLSSNAYASGDDDTIKSGQVVISVPSDSFERAKSDAAQLGTVRGQSHSTQNVTEEYVDLQSRIKNQQAYVDSIQALLAKAETIDEILRVQQTLTYAQEQLEQLKGRLQYLEAHTSFSTLTMSIYETGTEVVATSEGWGFVQALKDAAHNLVDAFSAVARGLGWLVPILVIVAVLFGIIYATVRASGGRRRKQRQDGKDVQRREGGEDKDS